MDLDRHPLSFLPPFPAEAFPSSFSLLPISDSIPPDEIFLLSDLPCSIVDGERERKSELAENDSMSQHSTNRSETCRRVSYNRLVYELVIDQALGL
jgi:hypothetical protein